MARTSQKSFTIDTFPSIMLLYSTSHTVYFENDIIPALYDGIEAVG
jgi:hypothetical protein